VHVLVQQARCFGPFPLSYEEVLDEEQNHLLAAVHVHVDEQNSRKPFYLVQDKEVTQEDKDFICKTMQLDPRDRPTADELLADRWFSLP
jgi:casein kinase II subunit alpha